MLPPLTAAPLGPTGSGEVGRATATGDSRPLLWTGLVLVFTYIFLANSWVGDDAYISFRVVDNFIHGYGLRWNTAERVQVFTNPLWVLVMSACSAVTSDVFYTSLGLSYVCCLACLYVAIRYVDGAWRVGLFATLVLSSKAFVDYTSSGLEYPLSYLLLAVFYFKLIDDFRTGSHLSRRNVRIAFAVASLAFLNRADALILYLPALAYLGYRHVARARLSAIPDLLGASSPAIAWLVFSLVYYGFPFPNPYYAKVAIGIPHWIQMRQGLAYLLNSVHFDPATLGLVVLGLVVAARQRQAVYVLSACAVLLNLAYVVWVGGDFMSGRFLTLAFLASAIVLITLVRTTTEVWLLLGVAVLYNVVNPLAPIKTTASYAMGWEWRLQNGVKDERGGYHRETNLLFYAPLHSLPDHVWVREGKSLRDSSATVAIKSSIGFVGFYAGPEKYIIDSNALSDPFLARLPIDERVYFDFNISHFSRPIPAGYVESRQTNTNLVQDALLRDYYDRVANVTSGRIFTANRFRDIFSLNLGRYRAFQDLVRAQRMVDVSAAATNPRFASDVGDRDVVHGRIIASGPEGYLQLGPAIPLRVGEYRVSWQGTVPAGAPSELGFVKVCYDDCRISVKQLRITKAAYDPGSGILAEVSFKLGRNVDDLECRFYVKQDSGVVLEQFRLTELR